MITPVYMRRHDAANYLQQKWGKPCATSTLAKLAVVGGGPPYRKAGRTPLYTAEDLDLWAVSRIGGPQRSTADVATQRTTRGHTKAPVQAAPETAPAEMPSPGNDVGKSATSDSEDGHNER
jgi:hypothetical protein